MVRNAGKFGKPKRGGKKQFTQDLGESERAGMWDGAGSEEESGSGTETGSTSEGEESSGESSGAGGLASQLASSRLAGGPSSGGDPPGQTRAERKAAKKLAAGKLPAGSAADHPVDSDDEADLLPDIDLANANRIPKKPVKLSHISAADSAPMNRKEREAAEKKAAQERYRKLHEAGKTDEAKVDLARLAKIRQEREQAAALRKAEAEAKAKEAADRAALSGRKKR